MVVSKHIFFGKVLPERAMISVGELQFGCQASADLPPGDLFVEIVVSQISARFVCEGEVRNLFSLRNLVEECVRMILDAVGFYAGYGYDAEIVMYVQPETSAKHVFGIDVPAVSAIAKDAGLTPDDVIAVLAQAQTSHFRQALADLREATKIPSDTGFFCYRALEALKNATAVEHALDPKGAASWEKYRDLYSIAKDDIMYVKSLADPVRHARGLQIQGMTDDARAKAFRIAWSAVCAYVKASMRRTNPS